MHVVKQFIKKYMLCTLLLFLLSHAKGESWKEYNLRAENSLRAQQAAQQAAQKTTKTQATLPITQSKPKLAAPQQTFPWSTYSWKPALEVQTPQTISHPAIKLNADQLGAMNAEQLRNRVAKLKEEAKKDFGPAMQVELQRAQQALKKQERKESQERRFGLYKALPYTQAPPRGYFGTAWDRLRAGWGTDTYGMYYKDLKSEEAELKKQQDFLEKLRIEDEKERQERIRIWQEEERKQRAAEEERKLLEQQKIQEQKQLDEQIAAALAKSEEALAQYKKAQQEKKEREQKELEELKQKQEEELKRKKQADREERHKKLLLKQQEQKEREKKQAALDEAMMGSSGSGVASAGSAGEAGVQAYSATPDEIKFQEVLANNLKDDERKLKQARRDLIHGASSTKPTEQIYKLIEVIKNGNQALEQIRQILEKDLSIEERKERFRELAREYAEKREALLGKQAQLVKFASSQQVPIKEVQGPVIPVSTIPEQQTAQKQGEGLIFDPEINNVVVVLQGNIRKLQKDIGELESAIGYKTGFVDNTEKIEQAKQEITIIREALGELERMPQSFSRQEKRNYTQTILERANQDINEMRAE